MIFLLVGAAQGMLYRGRIAGVHMFSLRVVSVLALSMSVACGPRAVGEAQRSTNIAANDGFLYVADADNSELLKVNLASQQIESLIVGTDPKRLTRIGDRIYVTLGAERSVAVVVDAPGGMTVEGIHEVGAEPYGIIASPDGESLYVALSMEDAVVELDAGTLVESRRFAVEGQPRWLAGHPNGRVIYAGSAYKGVFVMIDLDDGAVQQVKLPEVTREAFTEPENDIGASEEDFFTEVELTPRVTGDPALSADGDVLAVPVLYVDHSTSVGGVDPSKDGEFEEDFGESSGGGYASGNLEAGLTRFNPAMVTVVLDNAGRPTNGGATAMLVAGRAATTALDDHLQHEQGMFGGEPVEEDFLRAGTRVRGYITSLAFNASGETVVATMEGARTVVTLPIVPVKRGEPSRFEFNELGDVGISNAPMSLVGTADGPTGIAYTSAGEAWVFNTLSRTLSSIDVDRAELRIIEQTEQTFSRNATWFAGDRIALKPTLLPPDVVEGRRLFFSATDSSMAVAGAGVSCATCHFEGRNDGLTWTFDHGGRQTPSLAGMVSLTAPVTWTNGVGSVAEEARITSQGRMGGSGIEHRQTGDIAAFIDFTRDVDIKHGEAAALARGREVFERADVGCATCHSGERYTDNRSYDMHGLEGVNTPGLVGLAATGPYLHDGAAATLGDLLKMADEIGMGSTEMLSTQEMDDLEAYLRSL